LILFSKISHNASEKISGIIVYGRGAPGSLTISFPTIPVNNARGPTPCPAPETNPAAAIYNLIGIAAAIEGIYNRIFMVLGGPEVPAYILITKLGLRLCIVANLSHIFYLSLIIHYLHPSQSEGCLVYPT
jgi:hypothetical protein